MANSDRIVKFRLVTYFDEVENQVTPQGDNVLVERTASLGEKVSLRPADERRLDSLGALYSKDDAKKIEAGTYKGQDATLLAAARGGIFGAPEQVEGEGAGEGIDVAEASVDEIATFINENRLNVDKTVALAGDDEDSINKVLDAEALATDNDPRKGVTDRLEVKLAAATQA